ncbi:HEPN-associated N-terminal domain-containing protein [Kocuria rosea]|uniref:RES domain-containing protein n=1 Tax=Kocuria rosea TaxID=1275 RepID=A0A4R5YJK2_KOCRO|nr:HEPN-associated N-terminal domain-containing protein [Kocuria rosea]TDL44668.1 RES domain-containing protein [Kocuria rosea]
MGLAKKQQMCEWEQGWSSVAKSVCDDCLTEPVLAAAVQGAVDAYACDYCDRRSEESIAAPVDVVLDAIVRGLRVEYGDPNDEGALWVSKDGGYQVPTYDTGDLLWDFGVTENDDLHADLSSAIGRTWCQRGPYRPTDHEALSWGWERFREHVTRRARYTFLLRTPGSEEQRDWGEIPPEDMPQALAQTIQSGGLTRVIPAGTRWVRVRPHESTESPRSAKELGSSPSKWAKTNRMSAAGISAFYGASTQAGALAEVAGYAEPGAYATVGTWKTTRPMLVVDLVELPVIPSLFDPERRHLRQALSFLHGFAADVARPARPDDYQNLDYVPTQVIAEYLHQLLRDSEGRPVMGVLWRSSKDPSVTDCVLFVGNDGCVEQGSERHGEVDASWLALIPGTQRRGRFAHTPRWVEDRPEAETWSAPPPPPL